MTHRRIPSVLAVASTALLLAACQITIGPWPQWPPPIAGTLEAEATYAPSVQASGELAPGATRYYALDVDVVRDLVYAEVQGDPDLRVALYSLGGTRLAVSESEAFFGGSLASLGAAPDGVAPSSITVVFPCVGPCVAVPSVASSYVVAVTNTAGSSRSYELFAFTFDENDTNEPNDTVGSAELLSGAGTYEGAIEVLGDVDYFVYDATAAGDFFVVFDPFDPQLGLELDIVDCAECTVLDGSAGRRVEGLLDGDVLRVRSVAGRAGPSATSGYSLWVTSDPPVSSVSRR